MKYKIDHPREIVHEFTSIADSRKMYSLEQYLFKQREDGEVSKDPRRLMIQTSGQTISCL